MSIKNWLRESQLATLLLKPPPEPPKTSTAEDIIAAAVLKSIAENFDKWVYSQMSEKLTGPDIMVIWTSNQHRVGVGVGKANYTGLHDEQADDNLWYQKTKRVSYKIGFVNNVPIGEEATEAILNGYLALKDEYESLAALKKKAKEEAKKLEAQWDLAEKLLKLGESNETQPEAVREGLPQEGTNGRRAAKRVRVWSGTLPRKPARKRLPKNLLAPI